MFGHHKESRAGLYQKIAVSFFVLSIFLILIVFYISFAWATITITPKPIPVSEGFNAQLVDVPSDQQLKSDQFRGTIIQKKLEGEGTFSTTIQAQLEAPKILSGTITIYNTSGKAQPLRETTRLVNPDGILFRTQEFTNVPPGGSVSVRVRADKEGEYGTINDSRFTLPGLWPGLQNNIYGAGLSVDSGSGSVHVFTKEDLEKASQDIQAKLKEKMGLMLESQAIQSGMGAVGNFEKIIDVEVLNAKADHEIGDRTDEFSLRVSARVTALQYNQQTLSEFVTKKLLGKVGPGYDLLPPTENDVQISVERVDVALNQANLKIVTRAGRIRADDSQAFDKTELAGMSADKVRTYFSTFDDIQDVQVQFYPFWVTRSPLLTDNITILVKK